MINDCIGTSLYKIVYQLYTKVSSNPMPTSHAPLFLTMTKNHPCPPRTDPLHPALFAF